MYFQDLVFDMVIYCNIKFGEVFSFGGIIVMYDVVSKGFINYFNFVCEILQCNNMMCVDNLEKIIQLN